MGKGKRRTNSHSGYAVHRCILSHLKSTSFIHHELGEVTVEDKSTEVVFNTTVVKDLLVIDKGGTPHLLEMPHFGKYNHLWTWLPNEK